MDAVSVSQPTTDAPNDASVDAYIVRIENDLAIGQLLSPEQSEVYAALTALLDAEADARSAFSSFYAAQPVGGDSSAALSVPGDVAVRINRWVSLRQEWDALVHVAFRYSLYLVRFL